MINKLYKKYKATDYQDLLAINPLSFILRKAELGLDLTESEWVWLRQQRFSETMEIIKNQENYRISLYKEIHQEAIKLRINRFLPFSIIKETDTTGSLIDSGRAFVLYKVNAQQRLMANELRFVNQDYHRFLDAKDFNERKQKHGITEDIPYGSIAVNILEKLEKQSSLSATDIKWLRTHKANSFLTLLQNQFSYLQNKYKATGKSTNTNSPLMLCCILQKLDENKALDEVDVEYLKAEGLTETLEIVQKIEFSSLKEKYHATQIQEDDISHHLFKVLKKLEAGLPLPEPDINYLKKRKLFETVKFVYQKEADSLIDKINQGHGLRPDDVKWCEEHNFEEIIFRWLKKEYAVETRKDTPESLLYVILKKLKIGKRLTEDEVVWLVGEKWLRKPQEEWGERRTLQSNKIYIAHYTLEAQFHENEFQRTKDRWNLVNASADWRKAEEPEKALEQTHNLDFKQIKKAKLVAALLTTRGGALRDIHELNKAEKCALEAIKYFPDSHNPYTLMGALCYDTGRYDEGDKWFDEAIKRGAKPQDQDAEIKRILYKKKEPERQALIDHLLNKDPDRFAWLKTWKAVKR